MNIDQRLEMSYFQTIAELNHDHEVYLVQHSQNKKICVKKVLHVYNINVYRYLQEHPIQGIPRVFLLCEENGVLTIVEEYISGSTLEEMLNVNGPMPEKAVGKYISELLAILEKLHSVKPSIIHRDIKPSNIIITPKDHVMLIDLNASRPDVKKEEDTRLLGTKGYAAPEQYGFGSSDTRTDLYAVGMLMNTMLWGRFEQVIFPKSIYTPLIRNCTQMNPKDRYKDAAKLRKSIHSPYDVESTAGSDWRRFLPPGFRKGVFIHTATAILGYIEILYFSIVLFSVDEVTGLGQIIASTCLILTPLGIVLISSNYLNIQWVMPLCRNKNVFIRYLGVIILDVAVMIFFVIITAIIIVITRQDTL